MKNIFETCTSALAAVGLSSALLGPAVGQTTDRDTRSDPQKPVMERYEAPSSDNDDLSETDPNVINDDESNLQRGDTQKPPLETYDSRPSPPGDQTRGQQPAPAGQVLTDDEELSEVDESSLEGQRGDSQKPVLETYDSKPSPPGDDNQGQQPPPADSWNPWFVPRDLNPEDGQDR